MKKALVLAVMLLALSCADSPVGPVPAGLLSSPECITVNGTPVVLHEADVSSDGRHGMSVLGFLRTGDGTSLNGVTDGRLWVIHGDQAWTSTAARVAEPMPPDIIEKFVAGE